MRYNTPAIRYVSTYSWRLDYKTEQDLTFQAIL